MVTGHASYKAQINRYDINDLLSQYPEVVYNDPDQYKLRGYGQITEIGHYLKPQNRMDRGMSIPLCNINFAS